MTFKKFCPKCNNGFDLTEDHLNRNLICPVCEEKFFISAEDVNVNERKEPIPSIAIPVSIPASSETSNTNKEPQYTKSESGFLSDFYHFRIMILPTYIKIICILDMILAILSGFALAISGLFMGSFGILIVLIGLIVMIILPIFVRFIAEYLSVQFTINSTLQRIEKLLEERK